MEKVFFKEKDNNLYFLNYTTETGLLRESENFWAGSYRNQSLITTTKCYLLLYFEINNNWMLRIRNKVEILNACHPSYWSFRKINLTCIAQNKIEQKNETKQFFFLLRDRILLCCSGCLWTDDSLASASEFWDYLCLPLHQAQKVLYQKYHAWR